MAKVIITGTPGSGKSTIISKIKKYKIFNIGTEILKRVPDKSISRDELRNKLKYHEVLKIRKTVFDELEKVKGNAIIDTHTSVKSGNKYIPGFSKSDLSVMKDVKAIIYIDALAVDILLRRIGDKTRNREDETAEEIEEHRSVNLGLASYYAVYLGVPLYIIKNKQDRLDEIRKEIEKVLKDSFSK
ncbi:MAG: AAA family ATPase [Candidatus Micrarchaeaceae archaeon]